MTVRAPDGFRLRAYRLRRRDGLSDKPPRGRIFFIQGSGQETVLRYRDLLTRILPPGFEAVLTERRGVGRWRTNKRTWLESSSKSARVRDHLAVVSVCLRHSERSVRLALFGASEGGDVAASVAAQLPAASHLILWAVGGGWNQERELRHLMASGVAIDGVDGPAELDRRLARIRAAPDSLELWSGLPYRRWSSYLWDSPLRDLLTLDIPIFLAHGQRDRSVPVQSAQTLAQCFAERGKNNLRYREYPNADHAFHHADTGASLLSAALTDVVDWMVDTGFCDRFAAAP